ncbi:MAG: hypothetical protein IKV33_06935 [Alistipes sp.]|nr:hypothetical protein [Alistipes sp.]
MNIEGVDIVVSDHEYDYYWSQYRCGEKSDAFQVACRRILKLGPKDHSLDVGYVNDRIWGDKTQDKVQQLLNSGIVEYKEKWLVEDNAIHDAQYTVAKEREINPIDEDFEDDLIL